MRLPKCAQRDVSTKAPDPDVWFDLGAVFATAYERGRYARSLPYDDPITLPLAEDDRNWALWLDLATVSKGSTQRAALKRALQLNPLTPEIAQFRAGLPSQTVRKRK